MISHRPPAPGIRAAGSAAPARPHALALHRRHRRGARRRRRRPPRPRGRQERRRARHDVRRADQDDDRAGDLLHDRARHRVGAQGRHRRQGRRPGVRLLPRDVDVRARDRPGRRQPHPPRQRHAPVGDRRGQGRRAGREGARVRWPDGLRPGHHSRHAVLGADGRQCAAGAFRRAARRVRAAGDGQRGGAGPARHRAPAEAGVQGPRDDPVAGADRRVRRDRQRRRADRLDRGDATADADARLLRHLRAVRVRRARHAAARGVGCLDLQAGALPGPRVPADLLDVVVGVRAAAADRQDGAPGRRPQHRRCRRADRLLVQPGRHRDLPDDGVAVHRRRAWAARCRSASRSACWCS